MVALLVSLPTINLPISAALMLPSAVGKWLRRVSRCGRQAVWMAPHNTWLPSTGILACSTPLTMAQVTILCGAPVRCSVMSAVS